MQDFVTVDRRAWKGRVEDDRLITGKGRYSADLRRPGQLYGVFVRSPHAHAHILSIDIEAAHDAHDVVDVVLAADLDAIEEFGAIDLSNPPPGKGRDGRETIAPPRPALARDRVRHVGEPVVLVVARTAAAAQDAADLVVVDYEDLPSVTDLRSAVAEGAPQIWDEAPGNLSIDWPGPKWSAEEDAEIERIFAGAAMVARTEDLSQRIAGVPMEPRGATAEYDPDSGRYTLFCGSQSAQALRNQVASSIGLDPNKLHVQTDDVGGGFGLKTGVYPEYPAIMAAARRTGRPVHWMNTRSEAFMSDNQARDQLASAELALDADGKFLALRIDAMTSMGAYLTSNGVRLATYNFSRCFPTVYTIPHIAIGVRCVFTNTVPTGPYRGAGRPEANYVMERLVEEAARVTGIDKVELRRRNMTPPSAMPYQTAVGTVIDSGEFERIFDEALAEIDYDGFASRRRESESRSRLRGIGISCFLEHAGAVGLEGALLAFPETGRMDVQLVAQSNGQGHVTVFRDLVAARLGVPADTVTVKEGNSDVPVKGGASVASRSAMTVSAAIASATDTIVEKGKRLAADLLEASEADVAFADGRFTIAGTDRGISLYDVAARAKEMAERGEREESLDTNATTDIPQTFPNGCHIVELEIEPATGQIFMLDYVAIDDCGYMLNEVIVEGQVIGAMAQGFGQALLEQIVNDPDSGQLITGTFNDYAMPRAEQVPLTIKSHMHPVLSTTNPLGVKGVGEAGTTAAIAAIMNAVADAIPEGRGVGMQMPATPEKVWRACAGL